MIPGAGYARVAVGILHVYDVAWYGREGVISTLDAYCLVYDGEPEWLNGADASHWEAFSEGVYHLGRVRFRAVTLAHKFDLNTALLHSNVLCLYRSPTKCC